MKINLKVRAKNPVFWLTFIPAVATFVYSMLACFEITPAVSQETVINAFTAMITALTTLGVLVDPTTRGTSDSERALGYIDPQ